MIDNRNDGFWIELFMHLVFQSSQFIVCQKEQDRPPSNTGMCQDNCTSLTNLVWKIDLTASLAVMFREIIALIYSNTLPPKMKIT